MIKYPIICGDGAHRSWNAALAEAVMLMKYGNLGDYFWKDEKFYDEYLSLIKLLAKIGKQVGKENLAYYIYKEQPKVLQIGLVIYTAKKYKFIPFTMQQIMEIFKNTYRKINNQNIEIKDINIEVKKDKKENIVDFLGEI